MKYYVLICFGVSAVWTDCWKTGCQLDSWKVTGCAQHGRITNGTSRCPGGKIYTCCTGSAPVPSTGGLLVDCWETGCQLTSWAVVGCAQYGRTESGKRSCPGGYIYNCCTGSGRAPNKSPNPNLTQSSGTRTGTESGVGGGAATKLHTNILLLLFFMFKNFTLVF